MTMKIIYINRQNNDGDGYVDVPCNPLPGSAIPLEYKPTTGSVVDRYIHGTIQNLKSMLKLTD